MYSISHSTRGHPLLFQAKAHAEQQLVAAAEKTANLQQELDAAKADAAAKAEESRSLGDKGRTCP